MLLLLLFVGIQLISNAQTKKKQDMTTVRLDGATSSDDEAAVRALEDRFAAAFNAGDIDAMMKN